MKRQNIFTKVVGIISKALTNEEFDQFALAIDGDPSLEFENALEAENAVRNPHQYVVKRKKPS